MKKSSLDATGLLALLRSAPDLYLILNPKLEIIEVSEAYLKATMITREGVLGRNIFEVFPDNPADHEATGVANLRASLGRVLQNKVADTMAVQKYDVRRPTGEFEERYWSPLNTPVLDKKNQVKFIIHRVEDVTEFIRLKENRNELSTHAQEMEYEILQRAQEIQEANKQLRALNEELVRNEETKSRLAAIVEFTDDAIIGKALDGTIYTWNAGAERLYGYTAKEMIGQSILLIFPEKRKAEFHATMKNIKQGKPANLLETERKHKDGHLIPVSVTISPVKDKNGDVIGACSIARDITEWKKIEKIKNEFISVVSHELRTPLTSIRGALGVLSSDLFENENQSAKPQELIDIAKNNCDRLARLINDILDIEKMNAGKMEYNFEIINVKELIDNVVVANESLVQGKNLKLMAIATKDIYIHADRDRLIQVLTNFVSNAVHYSPEDETITIKLTKNSNHIRVSVVDKGPGIPEEFRSKIFQPFTQVDSSNTRKQGGTGLGLNICKAIIDQHGGKINFVNLDPVGAEFYFELPIFDKKKPKIGKSVKNSCFPNKIPHILNVEDDVDIPHIMSLLLQDKARVKNATTLKEANKLLTSQLFDLVILDLKLPDGWGADLLPCINCATKSPIPVIVFSAYELQRKFTHLVKTSFLKSKVSNEQLIAAIQSAINLKERH